MEKDIDFFINGLKAMDQRVIARAISLIENSSRQASSLLLQLEPDSQIPIIGVTGPPGSGKSTLVNSMAGKLSAVGKRVAILAVDPSSPFNHGSLLGDRIRMTKQFLDPNIYIRSMASRGVLGGLAETTIEITDVLRSAYFDIIIVETVGVGQSELDIVGLADITLVVLVPEAGDSVQQIKSGIMEIADIFVVNKSDRPGADVFASNLRRNLQQNKQKTSVIQTTAETGEGIARLLDLMKKTEGKNNTYKIDLWVEKVWRLIQAQKMKAIDKAALRADLLSLLQTQATSFNIYRYASKWVD